MDFIAFFLLVSAFSTSAAQQSQSNISRESSLTPTTKSSWLSHSGLYAFGFYKQGNGYAVGIFVAGIPQKTVVWTANRDDPPVSSNATLLFTNDGRLVLQSRQSETNIADSRQPASSASMLDSGNFVLYNSSQQIVWQSFDYPTDTLLPSQRLLTGKELFSGISETNHNTGIFRLKMQGDGHLLQFPVDTPDATPYVYWGSGTAGSGDNVTLNFDADGHLYLLNATGINIKNLTVGGYPTEETIYLMRIDADGIFRLYSYDLKVKQNENWSIKWSSSDDLCNPKGLCGLNGYCTSIDREAECKCLPGFDQIQEGNRTAGCERGFTAENCFSGNDTYAIEELPNTEWEDASYSVLSLSNKEDCKQACLEDCNCEAALFIDQSCRKQRLPLRFGRRQLDNSNLALIKVGKSKPTTNIFERKESKNERRVGILIIGVSFGSFGVVMLLISGYVFYKNHVWAYRKLSYDGIGNVEFGEDVAPRSFSFSDLEKVTDGFKEELGRGSFGTVYKGVIWNGQKVVAVKRLDRLLAEREREFETEMKVIGRTHHKNLVRLLGYCHDGPNRLLVYEYMSNGSLADILFAPEKQPGWDDRMGIARNIARGILYLHEECESQIIHCDIKPQNILMDANMCPKISDFGLAKLLKPDQTKTLTGIRGTKGYVAPEWHRKLPVTVKADVYSFGIVLLEIICCRKSVNFDLPEVEAILEEWAYDCFHCGELDKLVTDVEIDKKQLMRMVKVALWCVQDEPSLRPSMKKILLMLEGTVDIPIPPSPTSFLSAI